jgi:GH24 family phage-related lysozyme (muramidase)
VLPIALTKYHHSSFNIGHAVEMSGFRWEEAQPLLQGLVGRVREPEAVLQAVLHWTGGQPFLTQKLLSLMVQSQQGARLAAAWVEQVALSEIVEHWEVQDVPPHLKTIRDRILQSDERGRGRPQLVQQQRARAETEKLRAQQALKQAEQQSRRADEEARKAADARLKLDAFKFMSAWEPLYLMPKIYPDGIAAIGLNHFVQGEDRETGKITIDGVSVDWRKGISKQQAIELLSQDLRKIDGDIDRLVKVNLNQNQRLALLSFIYNLGLGAFESSTLLKRINERHFDEVPSAFMIWGQEAGLGLGGRQKSIYGILLHKYQPRRQGHRLWLTGSIHLGLGCHHRQATCASPELSPATARAQSTTSKPSFNGWIASSLAMQNTPKTRPNAKPGSMPSRPVRPPLPSLPNPCSNNYANSREADPADGGNR